VAKWIFFVNLSEKINGNKKLHMALIQKSVINKHVKALDKYMLKAAYERFRKFYTNQARLNNILQLKEENYQEGF